MTKPPFLSTLKISNVSDSNEYPFSIPILRNGVQLEFNSVVTFIVGENGSGKSTILEAIADKAGYNKGGGNKNHLYDHYSTEASLYDFTTLGWVKKPFDGFFLRAESFYRFGQYLDDLAKESDKALNAYGGKSLHHQSHGESFLTLFSNKFDRGFFILDEPEAALSPMRQLTLINILFELVQNGNVQFIIATHSPILLTFPNSEIFNIVDGKIDKVNYDETEHFITSKNFINNPDAYLRHLAEIKR
jgi:predicted ATPase